MEWYSTLVQVPRNHIFSYQESQNQRQSEKIQVQGTIILPFLIEVFWKGLRRRCQVNYISGWGQLTHCYGLNIATCMTWSLFHSLKKQLLNACQSSFLNPQFVTNSATKMTIMMTLTTLRRDCVTPCCSHRECLWASKRANEHWAVWGSLLWN